MLMEVVIHRLIRGYDGDRNPCMNSLGLFLCRTVGSTCLISSARDTALKGDELRPSDDVPLHGRCLLWFSAAATSMDCLGCEPKLM